MVLWHSGDRHAGRRYIHPRMDDIEQAVSSYTKAIIVNSPITLPAWSSHREFIAEIVDFCERKKIYLIMDDIYHKLVFDGKTGCPRLTITPIRMSKISMVIVVNGVSKLYGMTGFRIGWVVANRKLVESDDQCPGADHLLPIRRSAGGSRRRADRHAEHGREPAADHSKITAM